MDFAEKWLVGKKSVLEDGALQEILNFLYTKYMHNSDVHYSRTIKLLSIVVIFHIVYLAGQIYFIGLIWQEAKIVCNIVLLVAEQDYHYRCQGYWSLLDHGGTQELTECV